MDVLGHLAFGVVVPILNNLLKFCKSSSSSSCFFFALSPRPFCTWLFWKNSHFVWTKKRTTQKHIVLVSFDVERRKSTRYKINSIDNLIPTPKECDAMRCNRRFSMFTADFNLQIKLNKNLKKSETLYKQRHTHTHTRQTNANRAQTKPKQTFERNKKIHKMQPHFVCNKTVLKNTFKRRANKLLHKLMAEREREKEKKQHKKKKTNCVMQFLRQNGKNCKMQQ